MYGDGGNDRIAGGLGPDTLCGGAGSDTFVFGVGCGSDKIVDFQDGSDKFDFSGLANVTPPADIQIEQVNSAQSVVRYFDGLASVEPPFLGRLPS